MTQKHFRLLIFFSLIFTLPLYSRARSHKKSTIPVTKLQQKYPYSLPPLPYTYNALEPYIDARTMCIHHNKHQKGYIDKLNKALTSWPEGQQIDLVEMLSKPEIIPEPIRTSVINNGGGAWIHTMFWNVISPHPAQKPGGKLAEMINKSFGSYGTFKKMFSDKAKSFFGSGWIWLVQKPDGKLKIISTPGHDLPQTQGDTPLLVLDVWEHAYYLKYQNRRDAYINNWWHIVNWQAISIRFDKHLQK